MATEWERVFSTAKRTITPERNALGEKVIEAYECLWWWWRTGAISGRLVVVPMISTLRGNLDTSGTHESPTVTVRVRRKGFLTVLIGSGQR